MYHNVKMAKGEEGSNKRRKLKHDNLLPSGNIRGAFELHNLLRFKQNGGPEVKAGIEEFKNFLTEVQRNENLSERQIQLKVLKQYCDEQSSSNGEELDFPDLLSTWSFAAQSNHEAVLSAVPAALSQFFRTISSELEFRGFGLSLCEAF
jgi:nucleolar pre-ribosomal-associated protein 1